MIPIYPFYSLSLLIIMIIDLAQLKVLVQQRSLGWPQWCSSSALNTMQLNLWVEVHPPMTMVMLYSNSGPHHYATQNSVHLSLIWLFLRFNLDYFCVDLTSSYYLCCNLVERIMIAMRLWLQRLVLVKRKTHKKCKSEAAKCMEQPLSIDRVGWMKEWICKHSKI